jgi:hypothetical protein
LDIWNTKQRKVQNLNFLVLQQGFAGVDEGLENGGEINWDVDFDDNGVEGAGHTANWLHEVPNNT